MELKTITFFYGRENILSNINLACVTGDIIGIFGRNGSGKSTLLRLIFGTLKPKSGQIFLNDMPSNKNLVLNKYIAYHHEQIFLPQNIMVRNLIPLYFPKGSDQNNIFHDSRISKMERQKVKSLSPGEQKYLQFLLLVNLNHHFVLLDEPFTMMEPLLKNAMKEIIMENRFRKGFIITDHYYLDVLEVATRKMMIKDNTVWPIFKDEELAASGYLPER